MGRKLVLFGAGIFLFLAFVYFSYLVHKKIYNQLDFDTTVKFQDHISRKFDLPFSLLTLLGSAEVTSLIWLGILIYFLIRRSFLTALSLFLFFFSLIFEVYGKTVLSHPGPPFMFYRGALSFIFPSSYVSTPYSYPSGHSLRSTFLIVFLLFFIQGKISNRAKYFFQAGLLFLLFLIYISRIYLGEHWFTDVVGGALLGSSLGLISSLTISTKKLTS